MNVLYGVLAGVNIQDPLLTPLTRSDLSGLGPVFYQAAEMDIWRDSAVFYCDKIRQAGGKARLMVYPGVVHTWWSIYPQLSINRKWARDLVEGVEWLLKPRKNGAVSMRL
jgi:acetyl esterase/lipase